MNEMNGLMKETNESMNKMNKSMNETNESMNEISTCRPFSGHILFYIFYKKMNFSVFLQ